MRITKGRTSEDKMVRGYNKTEIERLRILDAQHLNETNDNNAINDRNGINGNSDINAIDNLLSSIVIYRE